jgi:spore germination protein YaaH
VYGYLPYWVTLDLATFRWETITDIIAFGADLTSSGTISSWHGWPQTALIQTAHAQGKKALLGVVLFNTSAEPNAIATFLGSASAKSAAISTLVAKVKAGGGDGINLDFEFVPKASRDAYSAFVEDLDRALEAALPEASLTLAVPPGLNYRGYDAVRLSAAADRVLIMFYDYHWSSSPSTGPVAPLTKGGFWGQAVASDLDAYLAEAPAGKLALGVPYYGNDWPAASAVRNAATKGTATAVTVKNAIPNAAQRGRLWDAESQTPWYTYISTAGAQRQCWYDDDQSLALKFRLARSKGLGGAMIWALGYDSGRPQVGDALLAELGTTALPADGGSPDAGAADGGVSDAGTTDAGASDAGASDAGADDPDGGRDPGSPGQPDATAESGGCASTSASAWALLSLLGLGLFSGRRG